MLYKLKGFTLAEVLITLGIIGVVAAMTIPALVNYADEIALKTAWKKAFSVLSQAHTKIIADNSFPFSSHDAYFTALAGYLNTTKRCTLSTSGCWHASNEMYTVASTPIAFTGNSFDMVYYLNDGMFIYMGTGGYPPAAPFTPAISPNTSATMLVDVNGFKKPNKMGYDIYGLEVYGNALVPGGTSNSYYQGVLGIDGCNRDKPALATWNNGMTCGAKVLQNISY